MANSPEIWPLWASGRCLFKIYGPCDDGQAEAILNAALDLGLDHIDTSNVYGMGVSEQRIGSFLAKQGRRARFLHIATKAAICRDPDTGTRSFNNSAEHLESELDKVARMGLIMWIYFMFTAASLNCR